MSSTTMRRSNGNQGRRRSRPSSSGGSSGGGNAPAASSSSTRNKRTTTSNRLYMAPQATFTRSGNRLVMGDNDAPENNNNNANISSSSNNNNNNNAARRRRRNSAEHKAAATANSAVHATASVVDRSPTVLERQDSDSSLGAMAAVLAADRGLSLLPPAPILWSDSGHKHDPPSSSKNHHHHHMSPKPQMTMRKKMEKQSPPDTPSYMMHNHHHNRKHKTTAAISKTSNSRAGLHYGHEDFDATMEGGLDDSFANCDFSDHGGLESGNLPKSSNHSHTSTSKQHHPRGGGGPATKRWWNALWWSVKTSLKDKTEAASHTPFTVNHCAQLSILILLIVFVVDSHTKVQSHKNQLREYDEERSHILQQMMWIDNAAKKVHKKYNDKELLDNLLSGGEAGAAGGENAAAVDVNALKYEEQALRAQQDLYSIQHTIQLNARNHLTLTFGDKPAQVALQIPASSKNLLIGLSDDTPHAISTLVRQVNQHVWDKIRLRSNAETHSVELRSATSSSLSLQAPLLEFVERSRGCHDVGSVSLRQPPQNEEPEQNSNADQHEASSSLVLSVSLSENDAPLPDGSVCIGAVLEGLESLAEWQHQHPRDDGNEEEGE